MDNVLATAEPQAPPAANEGQLRSATRILSGQKVWLNRPLGSLGFSFITLGLFSFAAVLAATLFVGQSVIYAAILNTKISARVAVLVVALAIVTVRFAVIIFPFGYSLWTALFNEKVNDTRLALTHDGRRRAAWLFTVWCLAIFGSLATAIGLILHHVEAF